MWMSFKVCSLVQRSACNTATWIHNSSSGLQRSRNASRALRVTYNNKTQSLRRLLRTMAPVDPKDLEVRQYRDADFERVKDMFISGMDVHVEQFRKDHSDKPKECQDLKTSLTNYKKLALETDLADMSGIYDIVSEEEIANNPGKSYGNFWVVDHKGQAVGCVGLERKSDETAQLRRMSVDEDYRRLGIGKLLIKALEDWAKEQRFQKIVLSTGMHMPSAVEFYKRMNYKVARYDTYSPDPSVAPVHVAFFEKELRKAS